MHNNNWDIVGQIWSYKLMALDEDALTVGGLIACILLFVLMVKLVPKLNSRLMQALHRKVVIPAQWRQGLLRVARALLFVMAFLLIIKIVGVDHYFGRQVSNFYVGIHSILDLKLFKFGKTDITLWALSYLLVSSLVLVRAAAALRHYLANTLLSRARIQPSGKYLIGAGAQYLVLFLGFVVLLQSAGIDLSAITVMVGALGIGLSFGLQQITNNFICGLILLFERPIRIGDKVQVGDVVGSVRDISLRATTVVTGKNIAVLVPNSEFITGKVQNWTLNDSRVAITFPFQIQCKEHPAIIQKEMLSVLSNHKGISKDSKISVLFDEISGETCKFVITVMTDKYLETPDELKSDLILALSSYFRDYQPKTKTSDLILTPNGF